MTNTLKTIIVGVVALAVGIVIGVYSHRDTSFIAGAPSPSGATFSSGQVATQEVILTSTSTVASLLNSGSDKIINSVYCYLNNITGSGADNGLVGITAATSTSASGLVNSAGNVNSNYLARSLLATTSATTFNWFRNPTNSTTTAIVGNAVGSALGTSTIYWASGTYIDFLADEILVPPTYGICGVSVDSL